MGKSVWIAIDDLLDAHDGHLKLDVASACGWCGELRIGLTNPDGAPARAVVFYSAAGGSPTDVVRRLLADFEDWRKTSETIPSMEDLNHWLFEDGGRMAIDSAPGFPASEPVENQGLQEPEIEQSGKRRHLSFEQINEVTWKLTDGRGSLVPASHGQWAGHHTTRAVAWLMGIGNGRWIVRYRNKASRPMKLPAAKKYAVEMVRGIRPGRVVADPIGDLNRMQAVLAEYEAITGEREVA